MELTWRKLPGAAGQMGMYPMYPIIGGGSVHLQEAGPGRF